MKSLTLKLYPDKALRVVCKQINIVKSNHIRLAAQMHDLMKAHKGLGLAAPQVGRDIQVIVINTLGLDGGVRRTMFNPLVSHRSEETFSYKEGCLSIPGKAIDLNRSKTIDVMYTDSNNVEQLETFSGITAVAIMHECEHLQGMLFIDSELKKLDNPSKT